MLRCEWLIRIHPNDRIELSFSDFNVEYHGNCQFDYVAVFDGDTDASPVIGRYCGGTDPPPKIMSNSNKILIKFYTDYSVAHGGFRATYSTVCGGRFTDLEGSFHSPYYPERYPASATCYYQIQLPPGHIIHLNFPFFEIERHYACNFDYLEMHDGPGEESSLIGKYCGNTAPDFVTSTYNQLWLKFATDGSVQNRGFYANYTNSIIGCGGIMTNSSGSIGTPSHQTMYPPSITCTWLLRGSPGFVVRLTFDTFALERHENCDYDYVLVQDSNGAIINKYCGFTIPPVLLSTDNEMKVTFVADSSVSHEGFNASYTFLDTSRVCGGEYYVESGVLRTPNYPQNYPHSKDCEWILHAANGRQFLLNVTNFRLEQHEDCRFDYLEIRNGGYTTSPLIGKYCGETVPPLITSHSNMIRLEFHSDGSQSAPGFEIFYDSTTTGCGGTVTSPRSQIISPNYPNAYGHNAECTWVIRVSAGSAISISIVDLDIEDHHSCDYDFLEIYDGDSDSNRRLVRLCNGVHIPVPLISKGSNLLIKFRTDFSGNGRGFHLSYSTVCNNVLKKHRGVIESPNFPNTYPHNHNCSWKIEAPLGNNISLSFSHLFLENVTSCEADYVEILQVSENSNPVQLAKYCGTPFPLPLPIETTTNKAIVRLVTDRSVTREGFRLEYAVKGCGGELQKSYGTFTSPNYPHGYPRETVCEWTISYPPGERVQLQVVDLDVEGAEDCRYDALMVYAGEDANSPRLLNLCHKITDHQTVNSHGNHMFIRFHSDNIFEGKGFKAYYHMEYSECGGLFTAEHSTILSPGHPESYGANDDCEWLIRVDPLHIVELSFEEFNLPTSTNCTSGYVAVYDGDDIRKPLLAKYCGELHDIPLISSTSNTMLVRLAADGMNVAKGFKAHYHTGCGQRLLADNGGVISSPNYPHGSVDISNCSWIIYASDLGDRITLIITHLNFLESEDCARASLEIRDGDMPDSPLLQKICGRHVPPHITSQGSNMHVFLHFRGVFRATYMASTSHCGGTYTSVSGSFASPEYPNNYPIDTECVWIISASSGNKIMVSFSIFDLEDSSYCNMDHVEIRENNEEGRFIGRYCGNQIPSNITAANKVWIRFRSDETGASQGFLGHYGLIHDSDLNGTSGVIESPEYPHVHQSDDVFQWTITVPYYQFVSVNFLEMNVPRNRDQCTAAVKVYDGATTDAPELGSFCGFQIPDPVVSHGNQVTIQFKGKLYIQSLWRLQWNAVYETYGMVSQQPSGSTCWNEVNMNLTQSVEIVSPNYPNYYDNNYNCTWLLRTPPGNHIHLNFTYFSLEGNYPRYCNYDRIQIYTLPNIYVDSWTLNNTLCGRLWNFTAVSQNNFVKFMFITDGWGRRNGFNLTASTVCGGYVGGVSGMINSSEFLPYFDRPDVFQFQCEWTIHVRPRRTIKIQFDSPFNIPSVSSCSGRYLLLLNGAHETSPHLGSGKYCGASIPPELESGSNQVFVRLFMNSFHGGSPRFVLRFQELSMGCGGQVYLNTSTTSTIETPNYPAAPNHEMACDWIIMSPPGRRIRFTLSDAVRFTGNCYEGDNMEYVQLYDGGTELSEPLQRICYHTDGITVMSTGNTLFVRYVTAVDHPESPFKAEVSTAECGGIISYSYSEITSPKYPSNYSNGVECEWKLKLRYGLSYYLELWDLDTPQADDCHQTDYLEIRNEDKDGELIGTYCGTLDNGTTLINLPGFDTYMKFKANGRNTGKGFRLFLNTDYGSSCGGDLTEPSGVVTSPNYPLGSSNRQYCYWKIIAPFGRRVSVTFTQFNLLKDEQTGRCINSLQFYNASSWHRTAIPLCGNEIPNPIESSSDTLVVVFNNEGWAAGEGFIFSYSTDQEAICSNMLSPPSGNLALPNMTFGSAYWIECKWKLAATEQNRTTVIRFNTLDIPGDRSTYCRESHIYFVATIQSMSQWLGYFCGNMTANLPVVSSPAEETTIFFAASLETPFRGVNLSYSLSECGGVLDGYNATITSPGYPNNYTVNTVCHWILNVNYGDTITVTVTDMRMESNCDNDYLMIASSPYYESPVFGKFCGTTLPHAITSDSMTISILFHTDAYGTAPGFKLTTAEVERGCSGTIHRTQGYLTPPTASGNANRYANNIECEWIIEYREGSLVNLTFVGRFDIENSANCENDYLMIEDYDDAGVWIPQPKLCGLERPANFLSTSTKARITFHTNAQVSSDGFRISFSAACGGHFTHPEGTIRSANYPDLYNNNMNCQYLLGGPGKYVSLEFQDQFSIETHSECGFDYVAIYRGSTTSAPLAGKYCGSEAPPPISVSGYLLLEFVTDYSVTAHGFVAHYEIIDCGGNLTDPEGVIKTPKHGKDNLRYIYCTWNIFAQENRVISLRITEHSEESGFNCYSEILVVREWNSTGDLITRLCGGDEKSVVVKSTTSQIHLRYNFWYGQPSVIKAVYRNTLGVNQGCGGSKISSTGEINSPVDQSGNYEGQLDCSWTIIGEDEKTVKLTFNTFDLEAAVNGTCIYDYVEIRDGIYSGDPIIARFCSNSIPQPITASTNKMTVLLHTDSKTNKRGFRSTFSSLPTTCGPLSLNTSNVTQVLKSPGYPSSYPANTWCRWHFYANSYYDRVHIHFTDVDIPCNSDNYVEVNTQREISNPIRLCRNSSSHLPDITTRRDVWVSFRSGSSGQGRGFSLEYSLAECNRNYTKENDVIVSPRYPYYSRSTHCVMSVETAIGRTISLYFGRFLIQKIYGMQDTNCVNAYLKVYEGDVNSTAIATLCGNSIPNPVFSTGNKLTLEFTTSYRYHAVYYISYTTTDKGRGCGGSLSHTNGTFTSPLYPLAYNQQSSCVWYLAVPSFHSMTLRFSFYELTSLSGCETNYLELYEGHTEVPAKRIYRLCGDERPAAYNSQGNLLLLKLVTDHTNTAPGFVAHFEMNPYVNAQSPEILQVHQLQVSASIDET